MKRTWAKLGGQLGLACIGLGILLIGVAWNGAASVDFVTGQVPYLLSGGALGMALVALGIGLFVVQSNRKDRALLEAQVKELSENVARLANALGAGVAGNGSASAVATTTLAEGMVLVGASSFHRPDCKLAAGKPLAAMPMDAAAAEGLTPCRICNPTDLPAVAPHPAEDRTQRRLRRRSTTPS
jgi:hypothetical protein